MVSPIKDKVSTDLRRAGQEGKLRAERIRDILKASISQAAAEVKEGSTEIRTLVKDAMSAAVEGLREQQAETKENIAASIEGAIEGLTSAKEEAIAQTRTQIDHLETQLESQETALQEEVSGALVHIEEAGEGTSSNVRDTIRSVVSALRDTPEAALMRRRYAQLQTQLSVLRANLTANHGDRYDEIKKYLDDARSWYERTQSKAADLPPDTTYMRQKQADVEAKMAETGVALAQREKQIKQRLRELWHSTTELFRDSGSNSN